MNALSKIFALVLSIASITLASSGCQTGVPPSENARSDPQRLEFTRMIVHWTRYVEPGYLDFVREAEPEIAQVGFYGADFWSIAHLPDKNKGVTGPLLPIHAGVVEAQDPAERIRLSGDYFQEINRELKQRGVKPIGHFDVAKYLLGRPDQSGRPRDGFFKFYEELWDEKELGPKPVADPLELLSKNRDGSPYISFDEDAAPYTVYWGCSGQPPLAPGVEGLGQAGDRTGIGRLPDQLLLSGRLPLPLLRSRLQGSSGVPLRSAGAAPPVRNRRP